MRGEDGRCAEARRRCFSLLPCERLSSLVPRPTLRFADRVAHVCGTLVVASGFPGRRIGVQAF
jgi:hypothetical protein